MAEALVKVPELNWKHFDETLLLNPKLPSDDLKKLQSIYSKRSKLSDHLWLSSSGTSGTPKLIALSRDALLVSAKSVNQRLEATQQDTWALCLPSFHVGGIGVLARAHLSRSNVEVLEKWDALSFLNLCHSKKITLTSLVPAQLENLLAGGQMVPSSLRAIFVGGGNCRSEILEKAKDLGYCVLQTYGMSECASQVASQENPDGPLLSLPIWQLKLSDKGLLRVEGPALATAILSQSECLFPSQDGYFQSEDLVDLESLNEGLWKVFPKGRGADFCKIKGENVSLLRLQEIVESICSEMPLLTDAAIYFSTNSLGDAHIVIRLCAQQDYENQKELFLAQYQRRSLPFEAPHAVERVAFIERTALGKVVRSSKA